MWSCRWAISCESRPETLRDLVIELSARSIAPSSEQIVSKPWQVGMHACARLAAHIFRMAGAKATKFVCLQQARMHSIVSFFLFIFLFSIFFLSGTFDFRSWKGLEKVLNFFWKICANPGNVSSSSWQFRVVLAEQAAFHTPDLRDRQGWSMLSDCSNFEDEQTAALCTLEFYDVQGTLGERR